MNKRVALVTGAGSGVGRAAALALHRSGFDLALCGRREAALKETANLCGEGGAACVPMRADVSNADDVTTLFAEIASHFGRLDLLFNNAGVAAPAVPLDELDIDDWRSCLDTNVTGCFLCARAAMGMMKRQLPRGGRIINNGSVSAHAPRPFSAPYTTSKHAITGLTKSISLDGRADDIVCSQIDIGNADTALAEKFKTGVLQADGNIRSEPVFDLAQCGQAVAYMASLPLETNIQFMTIMATKMPYIGRG